MKKWGFSIFIGLSIILLTGCGEQVESLLDKANQLLDQQLENGNNTDTSSEQDGGGEDNADVVTDDGFGHGPDENQMTDENATMDDNDGVVTDDGDGSDDNDGVVMDDGYGHGPDEGQMTEDDATTDENDRVVMDDGYRHGPDEDATTTVEALIQRGEYHSIDLPNGYPLPLPPSNWHLVQMIKDPEEGASAWEGVFCFTGALDSEISNYENQLFNEGFSVISDPIDSDSTLDAKHSTKFNYQNVVEGDMNYYIDQYGNPCTTVYFTFN